MKIEIHPHLPFVPPNAHILILGSFPGKGYSEKNNSGEWFYASPKNQFWPIIRKVYNRELTGIEEKKSLFLEKGIAIADIFLKIKRKEGNNSDGNLEIIEYNDKELMKIMEGHKFEHIFATSVLVASVFKKFFPGIFIEALPSPSPRNARMKIEEKIKYYQVKLPR